MSHTISHSQTSHSDIRLLKVRELYCVYYCFSVFGAWACWVCLQCVCVCAWDVCAPGLFSCCDEAKGGGSNTHPAPNPLRQRTPKHRFVRKKKTLLCRMGFNVISASWITEPSPSLALPRGSTPDYCYPSHCLSLLLSPLTHFYLFHPLLAPISPCLSISASLSLSIPLLLLISNPP